MSRSARDNYWKNAARHSQEPVVRKDPGPIGDEIETHPAYGSIRLSRVSGFSALYGSDFPHQNCIEMEFYESECHRSLSSDHNYPGKPILRVAMTEAQWGSFVSSMSVGEGTPCTIRRRVTGDNLRYEDVPQIINKRTQPEKFDEDGRRHVVAAMGQLDELLKELESETSGLSKVKRQNLMASVQRAKSLIGPGLDFVADQFSEMLEEREEKQKTEVMAWMDNTIRRAGMSALGVMPMQLTGAAAAPVEIEGPREEGSTD